MLSRTHRISRKEIPQKNERGLLRSGAVLRFGVYGALSGTENPKFAVVVAKKYGSAAQRNRFRRVAYASIRNELKFANIAPIRVIITPTKKITGVGFDMIRSDIKKFFSQYAARQ